MSNSPTIPMKTTQNRLRWSLIVNVIIPFALYELLLHFHVSTFAALAWSAAIPTLDSVGTWTTQRRIDWIGAISVAGFGIQLLIGGLLGGNTLVLKINDVFTTGPLGLLFIGSALLGKPILVPLRDAVISSVSGPQAERLRSRPKSPRLMAYMSIAIGALLLLHAVLTVILALELPTATFLVASKLITWGGLAVLVLGVRAIRSKSIHQAGRVLNHD